MTCDRDKGRPTPTGGEGAELKPCPFCGATPFDAHPAGTAWFIGADHEPGCHFYDFQRTQAEAITAWNTRAYIEALDAGRGIGAAIPFEITDEVVHYIARSGGMCRGCADEHGICPTTGLPCDDSPKAIRTVLKALNYGVKNGYLRLSSLDASRTPGVGEREALQRLLTTAKLLYANSEGCAVNHYGEDFSLHGMPGWLATCAADIAAAEGLLSSPAGGGGFSAPAPDGASELGRPVTDQAEGVEPSKAGQILDARIKAAVAWFSALPRDEQEAHLRAQRESYVRSEMAWGDEGTRVTPPAEVERS